MQGSLGNGTDRVPGLSGLLESYTPEIPYKQKKTIPERRKESATTRTLVKERGKEAATIGKVEMCDWIVEEASEVDWKVQGASEADSGEDSQPFCPAKNSLLVPS